ncbi:unnamed protein product [Rotaria socialis]|uniref:Uncharacterized protein n=1 Tax=Rotaria socialis TaxID=392032 RepID=A0A818J5L6_9BILA|nr:unnamed protein product [Rotaria socialis]CAF4689266.1 unnamed protein product [Rotaria socialis]
MKSDVAVTNDWVYRRFFLSNIDSAPRLFCFNTSDGFTFGQINLDNDELVCESVDTNHFGFQINHLCWLSNTVYRPSRKQIKIGLTTLPTLNRRQQASLIYQNENKDSVQNLKWLDETVRLTPSSIDYNKSFDQISTSHLNGTVKIYNASQYSLSYQFVFSNHGVLHQLKWNPTESNLLLLAHQSRLNIFDFEHKTIGLTLNYDGKEHLADCTWITNDIIIGRHRQQILIWDKRASREPIRNEILDPFGQLEKLKCSLASPNHLISTYDARLAKIKIYDIRFLTMRQVESFDNISSSFLDYHWTINKMAIVVATHQGLLHWIDVNIPLNSKIFK